MQESLIIQRFSDRIEKVKHSICIPLKVAVFKSREREKQKIVQGILEHHDQRITERFFKRSIEIKQQIKRD
ncbi:hypothetical protein [Pedobacter sp. FW305-3-2-15-E-R2A2]|uniref:hypothetical protein n=1 Tax=Pedobacter sp. FW305-3-2-15-E-R2A2 TaxID=3140251 RepID=UPI00313FF562